MSKKREMVRYNYTREEKVSWGDMDALGHINNISYVKYFENARADFFHDKNFRIMVEKGSGAVLGGLEMEYRRQVVYPATLAVTVGVSEYTSRSFLVSCSMWNEQGECVARGFSRHMWIDFKTGRATRIPEIFKDKIKLE